MFWIPRAALAGAATIGLVVLCAPAALAADENVKYYTVTTSYNGSPENLTEISSRFLGSGSRSAELFNLNTGRTQPDGGALADSNKLDAGWMLVLPWDAVGAGVQYGVLPDKAPTSVVTPKPGATETPEPGASAGATTPAGTTPSGTTPTMVPTPEATKAPKRCKTPSVAIKSGKSDWATLKLAPEQAWTTSRGKGQLVAVVDSGADGTQSRLTGHVSQGLDIAGGTDRGDLDCVGTGTAMAGLIAGRKTGIAPSSTVMPVRVVVKNTQATAANSAKAITDAVRAGATVVAIGAYVDTTEPAVAQAINAAVDRDVVVVLAAPGANTPVNTAAAIRDDGVLRVGGVGVDGQGATDYTKGGVDVVAPGVNVETGEKSRSGTQYAVAYTAGAVALVRSAFPGLKAGQVSHRVTATAEKLGSDAEFGAGMISLASAVTTVLPEETAAQVPAASLSSDRPSGRTILLLASAGVAFLAAVLVVLRIRRLMNEDVPAAKPAEPASA